MKQNRFLGVFAIFFIINFLSFSYLKAAEFAAIEDAGITVAKDADGTVTLIGEDGSVISKVEEDELDTIAKNLDKLAADNQATLENLAKDTGLSSNFLKADSAEAQKIVSENQEVIQTEKKLEDENLIDSDEDDGGWPESKSDDSKELKTAGLQDLKEIRMQRASNQAAQDAVKNAIEKLGDNVEQALKDFKSTVGKNETLATKYLNKLKDLSGDTGYWKQVINDAVKSGNRAELEEACMEVAKNDAVADVVKMKGLPSDTELIISDAVNDINGAIHDLDIKALKKDPEAELATFKKNLDSKVLDSANEAFNRVDSALEGRQVTTLEDLNALPKGLSTLREDLSIAKENLTKAISTNSRLSDIADSLSEKGSAVLKGVKTWGAKIAETLGMAVLFMIPNIAQSAFLAEKQRQVELQTLAVPIKYGDWVFQIPDSCFNFDNPSATIPVYVRIPVKNVGDVINSDIAQNKFGGSIAGGTTDNNAVSRAIHTVGSTLASFGGNLDAQPERYNFKESAYYSYNPGIILTYFAGGFQSWGSVPVTSSQFTSGQVIDLTTGMVIDDSSNQINTTGLDGFKSYPLITPHDWHGQAPQQLSPDSVKDFLPQMKGKMSLAPDEVKYVTYVTVTSGSAGSASNSLESLFDCSCMDQDTNTCTMQECMIKKSLDKYHNGYSFAQPKLEGSTDSSRTVPTISVKPLHGWGPDGCKDLINTLNFGSSRPALPTPVPAADMTTNYSALGCWVYLATGTPFAQAVAAGSADTGINGPFVDYIIFLDANLNQVPLWVVLEKKHMSSNFAGSKSTTPQETVAYTSTDVGINPDIAYWTSIAAFNNATGKALSGFCDALENPYRYNFSGVNAGLAVADSNLAGVATQSTPAGTAVISSAIQDLSTFGQENNNLYGQFILHQAAMQNRLINGPFMYGSDALTVSSYSVVVPAASGSTGPLNQITLYEGSNCYGTTVPDLLMSFDSQSQTIATLPNPDVSNFYSLITDIAYTVKNGVLVPSNFSQAPLKKDSSNPAIYSLNTKKIGTYNILTQIESDLEASYPLASGGTAYIDQPVTVGGLSVAVSVAAYVAKQRTAWKNAFDSSIQKQGITLGALQLSMPGEFKTKAAIAAGAFIYQAIPSPSAAYVDQDLFVLVNTLSPTSADLQKPLNAFNQNSSTTVYLVSLMTGLMFDIQGNQIFHTADSSKPHRLNITNVDTTVATAIYQALILAFKFKSIAPGFSEKYLQMVDQYNSLAHRILGPYSFGDLSLGIYAADYAQGNFIYFDTAGMSHTDFKPKDFYVTFKGTSYQGSVLTDSTSNLLSIISGNLYDTNGNIIAKLSPTGLIKSLMPQISAGWRTSIKTLVEQRQSQMAELLAASKQEQEALDTILNTIATPPVVMNSSAVQTIITRLSSALPAPYGLLKYDPITEQYVHVSPTVASTTNSTDSDSNYIYFFFDVGAEKSKSVPMGGIYSVNGIQVKLVQGSLLKAMKDKLGIFVDPASGVQKLAIPLTQVPFIMQEDGQNVVIGSDSDDGDLICSTSTGFPGGPIEMLSGYYLYYSKTMQNYYIWESKTKRWITVVANNKGEGYLYHKDGSVIPMAQQVAVSKSNSDDMILLEENINSLMQGYLNGQRYVNIATGSPMTWISLSTGDEITVTAKSKTYTVVDSQNNTNSYSIDNSYTWRSLFAVPQILNGVQVSQITSAYQEAQVVMKADTVSHLLFNGIMYKTSATNGASYTMTPVQVSDTQTITVTFKTDENTQAPYVVINDGTQIINYVYVLDFLDETEFSVFSAKIGGTTATATRAFPVGLDAMQQKTVNIGNQAVTVSVPKEATYTLFAKHIPSNASGLKLSAVPIKSVKNQPTSGAAATAFAANFNQGGVLQSSDGRFFVELYAPATAQNNQLNFSYVSNGAYVDLHTGILYDTTSGISLGMSLNLNDLLSVLNKVYVSVIEKISDVKNTKSVLQLVYRSPQFIQEETASLQADTVVAAAA